MHFSLFFSVITAHCGMNSAKAFLLLSPTSFSSFLKLHSSTFPLAPISERHSWFEFPPQLGGKDQYPFCLSLASSSQWLHPLTTSLGFCLSLFLSITAGLSSSFSFRPGSIHFPLLSALLAVAFSPSNLYLHLRSFKPAIFATKLDSLTTLSFLSKGFYPPKQNKKTHTHILLS